MEMQERADAADRFDDERYERAKDVGQDNADDTAGKTDERSLGKEDVANIALSCTECAENTDFASTLDDGV